MKLTSKHIDKDGAGQVTILPEETEDMWHIYNILQLNDRLKATAVRKVQSESATGTVETQRTIEENKFVRLGAFHTLDLALHRPFTLAKQQWDSIALDTLHKACDASSRAEVAAVVLHEGLANVCLITESMTLVRQRIEVSVPRKKRGSSSDHDKGLQKFYQQVYQSILRHVDFAVVKSLIVGSPGFLNEALVKYMTAEAVRTDNKTILDNRSKILLCHCSSGHKQALTEILEDATFQNRLQDSRYAKETQLLQTFFKTLQTDPDRAYYGTDIATRRQYVMLVEAVKRAGRDVHIFSSLHPTGQQLAMTTGVAAILLYPLPEVEDDK